MINAFKNLCVGKLEAIPNNFSFPLMRWLSGNPHNLEACEFINTKFFFIPPQMVFSLLNLTTKKGFTKYPKGLKAEKENKTTTLIKESIKTYHSWSELEYNKNLEVVEKFLSDKDFYQILNEKIGFSKEECKLLGLKYEVKKHEPRPTGLSAFM